MAESQEESSLKDTLNTRERTPPRKPHLTLTNLNLRCTPSSSHEPENYQELTKRDESLSPKDRRRGNAILGQRNAESIWQVKKFLEEVKERRTSPQQSLEQASLHDALSLRVKCDRQQTEIARQKLELERCHRQLQIKESRLFEVLQLLKEKESIIASLQPREEMEDCQIVDTRALHTRIEELQIKCHDLEGIASELNTQNALLEKKVFSLHQELADKDGLLGGLTEDLHLHKNCLSQVEEENVELKKKLKIFNRISSENQSLREKDGILMEALSKKEEFIIELLSKNEKLKESLHQDIEQVSASEELRNKNQKLEMHVSYQETQLRSMGEQLSDLTAELVDERKKWQLLVHTPQEWRQLMESLDVKQSLLRSTLSEKDARIAQLEKKKGKKRDNEELARLKVERECIKKELKGLNQHSTMMKRFGRQESRTDLFRECQGASNIQILQEIHRLNSAGDRLKQFIDLFLVIILERNPILLEDMPHPTVQHGTGVRPHVLATASKSDLLVEVREQESGCQDLLRYNSVLFERVVNRDASILAHLMEKMRYGAD